MVNRSVLPKVGKIVLADVNGEVIVKRLSKVDGQMTLTADNPNYPDVKVGDFNESMIWGVVTNVIHQLQLHPFSFQFFTRLGYVLAEEVCESNQLSAR